jgi:hypothetical protein
MRAIQQAGAGLDLRELLTIDVAAELRKICRAQLQGPWQLPAELVRRALRSGAREIDVRFGRGQAVVSDDGPGLDPALLQWAAILVDRQRPDEERHRALTILERAGELFLLALAGLEGLRALHIDTVTGSQQHSLVFRQGAAADVGVGRAARAAGTRISVHAGGLDRRRAARWLADVARFARGSVAIDGAPVIDGFRDALVQVALAPPLRGRLALTLEGDTAHAYLLAHGVVTAHLSIPDAPAFEVAIELAPPQGEVTPARLRDAVMPQLPALVDQAAALIAASAVQAAAWPEPARARLAHLTLQAARRHLRPQEIERAAVFRTLEARRPALVDLATLRRAALAEGNGRRTLLALSPDEPAEAYAVGVEAVLRADEAERSLLAEVLDVRFRTPSRQESAYSLAAFARRLLRGARRLLLEGLALAAHPLRKPALPHSALSAVELAFLTALRERVRAQPGRDVEEVILCAGDAPLQGPRGRPAVLRLPRDNPTVRACVRAFQADPRWLRMIHLALTGRPTRVR